MKQSILLCITLVAHGLVAMDSSPKEENNPLFRSFSGGLEPTTTVSYTDTRLCSVSPDGSLVAIRPNLCAGRMVHLINREKNLLHTVKPKGIGYITACMFDDKNNLYVGDDVGTLAMLKKSEKWKLFKTSAKKAITFLDITTISDKKYIVAGTKEGMKVWDHSSDNFGFAKDILTTGGEVTCGAWGTATMFTAPHVYAGDNKGLMVWKPKLSLTESSIGGKYVHHVQAEVGPVTALSVVDQDTLVTGHANGACYVWDTQKVMPVQKIERKMLIPLPVRFVHLFNKNMLLSSIINKKQNTLLIMRTDVDNQNSQSGVTTHRDAASVCTFDKAHNKVICASGNNSITTFDYIAYK